MPRYRDALPLSSSDLFLTDGGLETTLMFDEGLELPCIASFVLLDQHEGREALRRYYRRHTSVAGEHGLGIVIDSPTWRASTDWGRQLGYSAVALEDTNRRAIELMEEVREESSQAPPILLAASVGPRADGYFPGSAMSTAEARDYHAEQIGTLARTEADLLSALTLNYVEEAIGIALAARDSGIPATLSFTVETDGRLPTGQPLGEAIAAVDEASGSYPLYYMVNCAHPTHFASELFAAAGKADWIERIGGVRVNASALSHEELDEAEELDSGNPEELGGQVAELHRQLEHLKVVGGCCGTDHRHIDRIAHACRAGNGARAGVGQTGS